MKNFIVFITTSSVLITYVYLNKVKKMDQIPNYDTSNIGHNYALIKFLFIDLPYAQQKNEEKLIKEFENKKDSINEEDLWRWNTHHQKKRCKQMENIDSETKKLFIKWIKTFNKDPMGYIRASSGQLKLPLDYKLRILAQGYLSDISETKRLWNEEDIRTNWSEVPYLIAEEDYVEFVDDDSLIIEEIDPEENPENCSIM